MKRHVYRWREYTYAVSKETTGLGALLSVECTVDTGKAPYGNLNTKITIHGRRIKHDY